MNTTNKILTFFLLVFAVIGSIGTIGWLIFEKAWVILIGALAVDYFAYKPFVERFKKFLE